MGDPKGFLKYRTRELPQGRQIPIRIRDWKEIYPENLPESTLAQQASRCMDCGIPFCHKGCPLGNLIPEWNDAVYKDDWETAIDRLHATNNFPEFTGRLCPAPCEGACVLGINQPAVTIKQIELSIAEKTFALKKLIPLKPIFNTGQRVAIVGSGPAGLAAAQQLTRAGHTVVVFEREDRVGGLLRYGIPEFKMEKDIIDRRIAQMVAEGTQFKTNIHVGEDITAAELEEQFHAIILAGGASQWRDLPIPGRELEGIYQAMEYLPWATKVQLGDIPVSPIDAKDKNVVVIGGGDTGADCLGTATRQGAKSVHQLEIMPKPPITRAANNPWPTYPLIYRVSSAHEENGERLYSVSTTKFLGNNGKVTALKGTEVKFINGKFEPVAGSEFEIQTDLVLLALGFLGPEKSKLLTELNVQFTDRGTVARKENFQTSNKKVFTAGDMGRGQSLIVWAIAEGRSCAAHVDKFLMGETALPAVVRFDEVQQS